MCERAADVETPPPAGLPPPQSPRVDSVNMRHVLRWRPPQDGCGAALLYSVQFQG